MTIIQPKKRKSVLLMLFLYFSLPLFGGVIGLVLFYNKTVNLEHSVIGMKGRVEVLLGQNAELKDDFFGFMKGENLERIARERKLVKETKPEYLEVPSTWEFASQY